MLSSGKPFHFSDIYRDYVELMFVVEPKGERRESCVGLFYCLTTLQSWPFLSSFLGQKHTFGNWRKVLNFDKWDCLESARKYWKAQKKLFHLELTRKNIYKKYFLCCCFSIFKYPFYYARLRIFSHKREIEGTAFYHLKRFAPPSSDWTKSEV